jgi:hypothetical protein
LPFLAAGMVLLARAPARAIQPASSATEPFATQPLFIPTSTPKATDLAGWMSETVIVMSRR